jgi:hypothetical protein
VFLVAAMEGFGDGENLDQASQGFDGIDAVASVVEFFRHSVALDVSLDGGVGD